jgi:hypothetical protein
MGDTNVVPAIGLGAVQYKAVSLDTVASLEANQVPIRVTQGKLTLCRVNWTKYKQPNRVDEIVTGWPDGELIDTTTGWRVQWWGTWLHRGTGPLLHFEDGTELRWEPGCVTVLAPPRDSQVAIVCAEPLNLQRTVLRWQRICFQPYGRDHLLVSETAALRQASQGHPEGLAWPPSEPQRLYRKQPRDRGGRNRNRGGRFNSW